MSNAQRTVDRIHAPEWEEDGERRSRILVGGDPAATDPFVVMGEEWFPPGTFGPHPHRGIETVSYLVEGEVEHRDSRGHRGVLHAGDVQWMTAGAGLLHSEEPPTGTRAHLLQLWVNLPADRKMVEPRYQELAKARVPVRREPGVAVHVFSGRSGDVVSPTENHVPVTMVEVELEPGATVVQELAGDDTAFVFVMGGTGLVGGDRTPVGEGELAWLTRTPDAETSEVTLSAPAEQPLRALLLAGRPLREPVVARGPFVMTTSEQVDEAYRDLRAGRFGVLAARTARS